MGHTLFDFFTFSPAPAHKHIAKLVGAKTIKVNRRMDLRIGLNMMFLGVSSAYPSVSTFTFIAVLLAELLGYNSIVFSNEHSADFGNLIYLGLLVNHQWCKSSVAEKMINDYIQHFITPGISTSSFLREFSELEIVRRFVRYPLDCVGEPKEMILAMHHAVKRREYTGDSAIRLFEKYFPENYDFDKLAREIFTDEKKQ